MFVFFKYFTRVNNFRLLLIKIRYSCLTKQLKQNDVVILFFFLIKFDVFFFFFFN